MIVKRASSNLKVKKNYEIKKGNDISQEILDFMKEINDRSDLPRERNEAYGNIDQLAKGFDVDVSDITIAKGNNWYVLSYENEEYIRVIDAVTPRFGNKEETEKEVISYLLTDIATKARKSRKNIGLFGYADTSFIDMAWEAFSGNKHFDFSYRLSLNHLHNESMYSIIAVPTRRKFGKGLLKNLQKTMQKLKRPKKYNPEDLPF